MKKILSFAFIAIAAVTLASCNSNPQPYTYSQPAPVVVQQPAVIDESYADPSQFYADPTYLNEPPVEQYVNGNRVLVDAATMAYLSYYNYSLANYYRSNPTVTHIHAYNNGSYAGYGRNYRGYVSAKSYRYHAPNPRYVTATPRVVTKNGNLDMRYKSNRNVVNQNRAMIASRPGYVGARTPVNAGYSRPVVAARTIATPRVVTSSRSVVTPRAYSAPVRQISAPRQRVTATVRSSSFSSPSRSYVKPSSSSRKRY